MSSCIGAGTLDDLLRKALGEILRHGERDDAVPTRGSNLEILGARLELTNPRARLSRSETRRRAVSAVAELCWYLSGTSAVKPIEFWVPMYADEAELDGTVNGAYGARLFGVGDDAQFKRVIETIRNSPGTRRAVLQIFDRKDLASPVRFHDVPCTCTIQLLQRSSALHMIVSMRSSDVYLGLPHDVFAFTMLQEIAARDLGLELGRYIHQAGSLHLYDTDIDGARSFLNEGWQSTLDPMPPMPQGAQWLHVQRLLSAEEQLRHNTVYAELDIPNDPFWADLVRVLALNLARHRDEQEARQIVEEMAHEAFSVFAASS